jgi:TolB-like protein
VADLVTGALVAGRFRIVELLGMGGMGAVYRAVQEPLEREVALKVIKDPKGSEDTRARFTREARLVAALRDPAIVTLYDFGITEDERPFLAMELIEGESLEARLARLGRLTVDEAVGILAAVARCLAVAHAEGVMHRDVKPANVMLTSSGHTKLVDFGIARHCAECDGLTAPGDVLGTPGFLPPEAVLSGKTDDPRGDIYGLGVTAYETLAGRPPFTAPTPLALVLKHAQEIPQALRKHIAIPKELDELVMAMMAKDPAERPTTREVAARLAGMVRTADDLQLSSTQLGGDPITGPLSQPLTRPARPSIAVLPFVCLGDDPEQEYFADGITEDVICELSRHPSLFVIGRASSFAYKGQRLSTQLVGRELGVRYIVEGSVRRAGKRVRVTAQLVDTETASPLWAERYDHDLHDLFEVQDAITRAIVAALPGRIEAAHLEKTRRRPTEDLDAYDLLLQVRDLHHKGSAEDNQKARVLLDRILELDDDFAQAHAWRACVIGQGFARGYLEVEKFEELDVVARESLERAAHGGAHDAECLRMMGELAIDDRDFDEALRINQRALELIPNEPRIVIQRGEILARLGRGSEALEWIERGIRLDPHSRQLFTWQLALAQFASGDLRLALESLEHITAKGFKHRLLIAICAHHLGNFAQARAAIGEVLTKMPITVDLFHRMCPFSPAETQQLCDEALTALGIPPGEERPEG